MPPAPNKESDAVWAYLVPSLLALCHAAIAFAVTSIAGSWMKFPTCS